MDDEVSEGGSRIFRHESRERHLEPTAGDPELARAVGDHLERHLGDFEVFHEIVSDHVHVDLFVAPPTEGRQWTTVVTCGMSERPMAAPPEMAPFRHAEVMLSLPPEWPLSTEAFEDESVYWPFRLLKMLARLPHEYDTWLWWSHTVPNGDPPEPYASGTRLCGALIWPPALVPESFAELTLSDGRLIHFYAVIPLHADEMELKLKRGADELAGHLADQGVNELLDPARPSVVPRKRGFFRR
jgi:hypothetical protein